VGRYILDARIFGHLRNLSPGAGGEIQLTDGIASLLAEQDVLAHRFRGVRYDCGSKLGYLKANIAFGAHHPEVGKEFRAYLEALGCDPRRL
jgi:UTP--glucose-1-phosphate uridylyltransferase